MGSDSVNPEPGPRERPTLSYGREQPEPIGGNVATGCLMALFTFVPIHMITGAFLSGPPGNAPTRMSVFVTAFVCFGLLYLSARHLESKGRRGVMVGAAAMTGACVLAAGICFAAGS